MKSADTTIAILGATSHIAKGLIARFCTMPAQGLVLFARSPERVSEFLRSIDCTAPVQVKPLDAFAAGSYDVVINCVGIGDPAVLRREITSIFRLTEETDNTVLGYLQGRPETLYINFSSGAVYGTEFDRPAEEARRASLEVNHLGPGHFYGIAKLHSEAKHRARQDLSIVDLRVFSYFSRYIDLKSEFLLCQIISCIREQREFFTGPADIIRDFVHPDDLSELVFRCIERRRMNDVLDVYSREPISKFTLLEFFASEHGLRYRVEESHTAAAPTGAKSNYYSLYKKAGSIGYAPRFTSLDCVREESLPLLTA